MHSLSAKLILLDALVVSCGCGATADRSEPVARQSPVSALESAAPTVEEMCVPMQVHAGAKFVDRSEGYAHVHRENVAPLKVEPPAAVLEDMSKRGENVIATHLSICSDSSGKENYRGLELTRYESFNRLVLARSEGLDLTALMVPDSNMRCFSWFVVWELEKNLCSSM